MMVSVARAASFTASLDRDSISLGETATLSLSFEGAQPKNVPTPDVPGLEFVNSGTSQNVSFINGAMSSTVTVSYSVTPERTGRFVIPAMTADVNGQRISSQPIELTVLQANAPPAAAVNSGSEVAFMKLILPRRKVYSGETLVAELQIFLRDDVQNFGNFQMNSTIADGFVIGKSAEGTRFRTQVGSRAYTVIPLSLALTVTRAGDLSLGPFSASMVVVLPSQNQGGDPFFSQFFNQGEQKQLTVATEQVSAESLPLPDRNVPANFNGAIGDYTMTVTAGPTDVTVGDPVTVQVQIAGRGSLDSIKLPAQTGWNDFKIISPTSKTDFSDALGLEGTKTFDEIVMPESANIHALPAFSFSFFNPDDGQYHILTHPSEQLIVRAGGATPMPTMIAAARNSGPENPTPQDILPIKEKLGTLAQVPAPWVASPAFIAVQTVPVLAFLGALAWRKRTDRLANNPRLRRQRAVAHLIEIGIGDLRSYAAENNSELFFTTLFRLLQEQLGERLDCPASSITEAATDDLAACGAPESLLNDLRELFQQCNQARYAPVRDPGELNSAAAKFEKLIAQLQALKI
ncbi:MAG TPA: BatD family protein [Verrucomicrobiae bacterium]|nr:BatD family protein [Verrucomicrobiae bacterium]